MAKYGKDLVRQKDINLIRTKARSIARLVIELEKETGLSQSLLRDYLKPRYFDAVANCVRRLGENESPQLALALGHYVKQLNLLKIGEAIKEGRNSTLMEAEQFARLMEASWSQTVASAMIKRQRMNKLQQEIKLPTADDISKLSRYIRIETEEAIFSKNRERVKKLVLSGLILFNKRRPMEVEELTFSDYRRAKSKQSDDYTKEIEDNLSVVEATVAKRYDNS